MASSTPYLCEYKSEYYIFEDKEWSASDDESSNDSKFNINLYAYLWVMVFGRWSLITRLASVLQALLTFPLQSSSIFLLWMYIVGWDSLDLLASSTSVPRTSRAFCCGHKWSFCHYPPCLVILSSIMLFHNSTSYIHPTSTITSSLRATDIRSCRLHSLLSLSLIYHISHHHHQFTQFFALRSLSLEDSYLVFLEDYLLPVPDKSTLLFYLHCTSSYLYIVSRTCIIFQIQLTSYPVIFYSSSGE